MSAGSNANPHLGSRVIVLGWAVLTPTAQIPETSDLDIAAVPH